MRKPLFALIDKDLVDLCPVGLQIEKRKPTIFLITSLHPRYDEVHEFHETTPARIYAEIDLRNSRPGLPRDRPGDKGRGSNRKQVVRKRYQATLCAHR